MTIDSLIVGIQFRIQSTQKCSYVATYLTSAFLCDVNNSMHKYGSEAGDFLPLANTVDCKVLTGCIRGAFLCSNANSSTYKCGSEADDFLRSGRTNFASKIGQVGQIY